MRKEAAKRVEPQPKKKFPKKKRIRTPRGQRRKVLGRPPHEPTKAQRQTVTLLAGLGIPHRRICTLIGVALSTLLVAYKSELANGKSDVERQLVNNLFRMSQRGDAVALRATMFMLQAKFQWSKYDLTPPKDPPSDEPVDENGEKLGKKEKANLLAQTAHKETSWDRLVGEGETVN